MNMNDTDIINIIKEKLKNGKIEEVDIDFLLRSNRNLKNYIIKTSENLHRVSLSYPLIIDKLRKNENFSLVRIQDGEWTCIFKIEPHYSNKMSTRLKSKKIIDNLSEKIFEIVKKKPKYYVCINAGTFDERINLVWDYVKPIDNLVVGEVFRRVSVEKGLDDFIIELGKRKVIVVGPQWLSTLKENFEFTHIISPFPGLYEEESIKKLSEQTELNINKSLNQNPIILYSCGLVAKVLTDEFYIKFGSEITQIDMGAIWDPYCGKVTRPYHNKVIKRIKEGK
jgi:hypothetical protein